MHGYETIVLPIVKYNKEYYKHMHVGHELLILDTISINDRLSFPSGHAAYSIYAGVFTAVICFIIIIIVSIIKMLIPFYSYICLLFPYPPLGHLSSC